MDLISMKFQSNGIYIFWNGTYILTMSKFWWSLTWATWMHPPIGSAMAYCHFYQGSLYDWGKLTKEEYVRKAGWFVWCWVSTWGSMDGSSFFKSWPELIPQMESVTFPSPFQRSLLNGSKWGHDLKNLDDGCLKKRPHGFKSDHYFRTCWFFNLNDGIWFDVKLLSPNGIY